jgi:hypothetical protein
MKLLLIIISLLILSSCETTGSTYNQSRTRYYSKDGQYQGYSTESNDRVRYYDSKGTYQGYSTKK